MTSSAASKVAAHFLQFRIQYSGIALLYYDYVLTFRSEVKYMWGRNFRFSTILYAFCRYALPANVLYVFAVTGKFPSKTRFIGTLSVLGRAAVVAALTARAYAVFGCNHIILLLLGPIALACMALDIAHVPGLRCSGSVDNYSVSLTLSILMRIFEFVAAILTTFRSILEFRVGKSWRFESGSVAIVCVQQGVMYIIFSTVISIVAAFLQYHAPAGSIFQRLFNALSLPLSCLLTARFLLQLREWQEKGSFHSANCNDGTVMNGTQTTQLQTISAFRAVEAFDAAVIDDFGDGEAMAALHSTSEWESDASQTYMGDGVMEMEER